MPRTRLLAALAAVLAACTPTGGTVSGPADTHCTQADGGVVAQAVDPQACQGEGDVADYGATLFNASGADDDCKYDVGLATAGVAQGQDATFTVTVKARATQAAVAGAGVNAEVFLSATHPAPNAGTATVEAPAGTYTLKPVRFDASGRWTVRLHLFEDCTDAPDSPHGHVAFYVDVP